MIIRNPYGFIAKHFKLINVILIALMLYLLLQLGDVVGFFNDYIANGYSTPETSFSDKYITGLMYGATAIIMIANIVLYIVFASKKKNNNIYLINVLYCIVLFVAMALFHSSMSSIEKDSLDPTFANFVRDCALISNLPMYILILFNASRAIGFNFRTFRFDNNSDLKIKEEDDDEIELKVGTGDTSLKKVLVHLIRELRYYVLENKFVFMCIGAVFLIFFGYNFYKEFQIYNKRVSINTPFNLDKFTLSLKESYISDVDYRGATIESGKYYLAIRMGIKNNAEDTIISNSSFRLYIGDEILYPSYDRSSRFLDIGEPYHGELIRKDEEHDYVFVYELDKNQVKSSYQLRILNDLTEKNGKLLKSYKKLTIRPQNITKTESLGELKPNQEVSFRKTTLGETKYLLKNVEISPVYKYSYETCDSKNFCRNTTDTLVARSGKTFLIVEDELTIDETTPYYKYESKDFYTDFTYIYFKYNLGSSTEVGDKYKTAPLENVTPMAIKDKKIYEVPSNISYANNIQLVIRIRNKYITTIIK